MASSTVLNSEALLAPSRASTDMPWVTAMTSPTSASGLVAGGSKPAVMSRLMRVRRQVAMPRLTSATACCTSLDASDPLAVALASRHPRHRHRQQALAHDFIREFARGFNLG